MKLDQLQKCRNMYNSVQLLQRLHHKDEPLMIHKSFLSKMHV